MSRAPKQEDPRLRDVGKEVRSGATGDVGTVVAEGGSFYVEVGNERWPYYRHEWLQIDKSSTIVAPHQRARVRYEVDRVLLAALGTRLKEWENLRDDERIRWVRNAGALACAANEGPRQLLRGKLLALVEETLSREDD